MFDKAVPFFIVVSVIVFYIASNSVAKTFYVVLKMIMSSISNTNFAS